MRGTSSSAATSTPYESRTRNHVLRSWRPCRRRARSRTRRRRRSRAPSCGAVRDIDGEAIWDPDQRLVDGRGGVASALDGHLVVDGALALLDPGALFARAVLENERIPQAQRVAVDLVGPFAPVVLDPESSPIASSLPRMANRSPAGPSFRCRSPMLSTVWRLPSPVRAISIHETGGRTDDRRPGAPERAVDR